MALVYAWAVQNPEMYCSWVKPYRAIKYAGEGRLQSVFVGGHFRKRAGFRLFPGNIRLTCKFEHDLAFPRYLEPPIIYGRRNRTFENLEIL